jgi:hypothetical protein
VGARTDAARAEVLAARQGVADEVTNLEASARAAVDVPARLRREPGRVLGVAGGAAFLLAGGPRRVLRGLRRAVRGPAADLPPSLLPDKVERALRALGEDGDRVRGALERDFARYLDEQAPQRRERDLAGTVSQLVGNVLRPASKRAGERLAASLFDADSETLRDAARKVRDRASTSRTGGSDR